MAGSVAAGLPVEVVVLTFGALAVFVAGCGADEVLAAFVEKAATELLVVFVLAGRGSALIGPVECIVVVVVVVVGGGFGLGAYR